MGEDGAIRRAQSQRGLPELCLSFPAGKTGRRISPRSAWTWTALSPPLPRPRLQAALKRPRVSEPSPGDPPAACTAALSPNLSLDHAGDPGARWSQLPTGVPPWLPRALQEVAGEPKHPTAEALHLGTSNVVRGLGGLGTPQGGVGLALLQHHLPPHPSCLADLLVVASQCLVCPLSTALGTLAPWRAPFAAVSAGLDGLRLTSPPAPAWPLPRG